MGLEKITEIDMTKRTSPRLLYDGRIRIMLGRPLDLNLKLRFALEILAQLEPDDRGILDVSVAKDNSRGYFLPDDTVSGSVPEPEPPSDPEASSQPEDDPGGEPSSEPEPGGEPEPSSEPQTTESGGNSQPEGGEGEESSGEASEPPAEGGEE